MPPRKSYCNYSGFVDLLRSFLGFVVITMSLYLGCVDLNVAPLLDSNDGEARPGVGLALNPDEVLYDLEDNQGGGPVKRESGLYL